MKSYLNFTLKGNQLLPVWIASFFFFLIPIHFLLGEFNELIAYDVPAGGPSKLFFFYLALVLTMAYIFLFHLAKLMVHSVEYKGVRMRSDYHAGKYIGIIISGLLLSIITIGVYVPWFIKNTHRFFVHGASYNSHKFAFRGKGGKLFTIMTITTILIPFLLTGFVVFTILKSEIDIWVYQLLILFSLVPNIYLIYKWMVDIRYKEYLISLDTEFFPAIAKIAIELTLAVILVFIFRLLTSICIILWLDTDFFPETGKIVIELVFAGTTFSIYFAMAFIRLYRYFSVHTKSNVVEGKQISMGYDGNQVSDFLFIWGQILLTVITLGTYFPWAFSRIVQRVLTQTYLATDFVALDRNNLKNENSI